MGLTLCVEDRKCNFIGDSDKVIFGGNSKKNSKDEIIKNFENCIIYSKSNEVYKKQKKIEKLEKRLKNLKNQLNNIEIKKN